MKTMKQSKHFSFTLNNPTEDPEPWIENFFEKEKPQYVCIGLEVAPTTGTPHFQGYVQFKKKRRYGKLATTYNATFDDSRGTDQHNYNYCSKDGNFHERGERVTISHGGKRTSGNTIAEVCIDIRDEIIAKRPRLEILHDYPHLGKHIDNLCELRPHRTEPPKVLYIWGATGSGKTTNILRAIKDSELDYYLKKPNSKWWFSYDNEPVALLEEFHSCFALSEFLQLCDGSKCYVEDKGKKLVFDSPFIILVSNRGPHEQYAKMKEDHRPSWDAYMRRVEHSFCTDSIGRCDVNPNPYEVIYRTVVDFLAVD